MTENNKEENDPNTTVRPDEAAVIWSSREGYRMFLPKWREDENIPIQAFALIACAMRLTEDEAFNIEMFEWYKEDKKSRKADRKLKIKK